MKHGDTPRVKAVVRCRLTMEMLCSAGALGAGDGWVVSPHAPPGLQSLSLGAPPGGSATGSVTTVGIGSLAGLSRRGSVQLNTDMVPQSSRQSSLASGVGALHSSVDRQGQQGWANSWVRADCPCNLI